MKRKILLAGALCSMYIFFSNCQFRSLTTDEITISTYGWSLHQVRGESIRLDSFPGGVPFVRFYPQGDVEVRAGSINVNGQFMLMNDILSVRFDAAALKSCTNDSQKNFLLALRRSNNYLLVKEKLYLMRDTAILLSFFPK